MKKKSIKIIALLLVVISAYFVGTTLSYFQDKKDSPDSQTARIAKYGLTLSADGNLFGSSYRGNTVSTRPNESGTWSANESGSTITVQATANGTGICAPGTKGSVNALKVTGSAEVDIQLEYDINIVGLSNWKAPATEGGSLAHYFPVNFTLKLNSGTAVTTTGVDYTTYTSYINALKAQIASYNKVVKAGQTVNDTVALSWEWPFTPTSDVDNRIRKDTYIGKLETPPNIQVTYSVTATQID